MLIVLLITLQLVQASDFIEMEVCYLDTSQRPAEFIPHPEGFKAYIRPEAVFGIVTARKGRGSGVQGIECTLLYAEKGTFFVIGSQDEIRERLRRAEHGRDQGENGQEDSH